VQVLSGDRVLATATTGDDGRFTVPDLPPGSYAARLPASEFAAPFRGLTWLGPALVTPVVISAWLWIMSGFAMTLIAAGLAAIPRDALEAARVDGATEWQVFRRITVPLLSPVLLVVFVTLVINVLKIFDLVLVIAPGSVQKEANVLALQMWQVSFGPGGGDQGLGSALAVLLFLLVVPAIAFNVRRFRGDRT
jgi:alpha-glucoside transport system permease protein